LKIYISHITRKRRGGIARREEVFDTENLIIGRSTACDVNLADPRILLKHAQLRLSSGKLFIDSLNQGSVFVLKHKDNENEGIRNIDVADTSIVNVGDKIVIGPFEVAFEEQLADDEVRLSVELVKPLKDETDDLLARSNLNFNGFIISKRKWAWTLALISLAITLIFPLMMNRENEIKTANINNFDYSSRSTSIWTTGEISAAHKFFAEDCEVCHQEPFKQVTNQTCMSCHSSIEKHANTALFPSASFEDNQCQNCHKEHQGNEMATVSSQDFCIDCHDSIENDELESNFRNVSDFGTSHPQFRPSIIIDTAGNVKRERAINTEPLPKEVSGVKFPHKNHLKVTGLRHPEKGIIQIECANCHLPDESGVSMLPISFEEHCHECHKLDFDRYLPNREMVHDKTEKLFEQISDIYSAVAYQGNYTEPESPEIIRRRPGTTINKKDSQIVDEWVKNKTRSILQGNMGKGKCSVCHLIEENEKIDLWNVSAVKITQQWFPKAKFDHQSHKNDKCTSCHDVNESITSSDVLQPSLEVCQNCHGGENAKNKIPTTCIGCHDFHQDHMDPMYSIKNDTALTLSLINKQ